MFIRSTYDLVCQLQAFKILLAKCFTRIVIRVSVPRIGVLSNIHPFHNRPSRRFPSRSPTENQYEEKYSSIFRVLAQEVAVRVSIDARSYRWFRHCSKMKPTQDSRVYHHMALSQEEMCSNSLIILSRLGLRGKRCRQKSMKSCRASPL